MSGELIAFCLSIGCGAAALLLWDALHGLRQAFVHGIIGNFILDTFWWFVSVSLFLWCMWKYMNLQLRFFEAFAFAGGALIYHCSVSPIARRVFCCIFEKIYRFFNFILKILLTPARFSYKILLGVFNALLKLKRN